MNKESKILIAGRSGQVGSAIERKFKAEGYDNIIGHTSSELDLREQSLVRRYFEEGGRSVCRQDRFGSGSQRPGETQSLGGRKNRGVRLLSGCRQKKTRPDRRHQFGDGESSQ